MFFKDSGHIEWLKSEEILPSNQLKDLDVLAAQAKMFTCGDVEIGHVVVSNMMNYIKDKGLKNVIELAENNHSDLVTGTYEGTKQFLIIIAIVGFGLFT